MLDGQVVNNNIMACFPAIKINLSVGPNLFRTERMRSGKVLPILLRDSVQNSVNGCGCECMDEGTNDWYEN